MKFIRYRTLLIIIVSIVIALVTLVSAYDSSSYQQSVTSDKHPPITAILHLLLGSQKNKVAHDDGPYTVDEDKSLSVAAPGVLVNDLDVNGGVAKLVRNANHGSVKLNGSGSFTYTPEDNYWGSDSFTYRVVNDGAFSNEAIVSIIVDPINDPPTTNAGEDGSVIINETIILNGDDSSDIDNDPLTYSWTLTDSPLESSAALFGADTDRPSLTPDKIGTYTVELVVYDGHLAGVPDSVIVSAVPADPDETAPANDTTVVTTTYGSTIFIYTGDDPIQSGVEEGTVEPALAAVIRGKVMEKDGTPLPGVAIAINNHPEYGQTLSRQDGMFDMVVNGGGHFTVKYHKVGYLPAQRKIHVPIQDWVMTPDVRLIQPDPLVTAVDLTSDQPFQVAQGSIVSDADGTRQAALLVPQGISAEVVLADGTTQPVTSLNIRATEYTVGLNGPETMPAKLPPQSAYTYCVEISADEAVAKVNGKDVLFSQPVPFYVDNFLGFPAGESVPVGYYDNDRGIWIPSDSGRIIDVLAISGAMAELDVDGDGVADNGVTLEDLGITDAELLKLATLYQAGDSLWRIQLDHLSTWDLNWGWIPPDDAVFPNQDPPQNNETTDQSCEVSGSIIECQNQILGERIPVVGTPFTLNYRSNNVPGRTDFLKIFLSGESVPDSLLGIKLVVEVAGRHFNQSFGPSTNQSTIFNWDGLDAYGRKLSGKQPATVRIGYHYQGEYGITDRFGYDARGAITGNVRDPLTLWQTFTTFWGAWEPAAAGLGSWTLDVHHSYNPLHQVMYLGGGGRQGGQLLHDQIVKLLESSDYWTMGAITAAPNGDIYFVGSAWGSQIVYKRDIDGNVTLVAGGGSSNAEGIPATDTGFAQAGVTGLAIGPDGFLYLCEPYAHRIRKIDDEGKIWTVIGAGVAGFSGDGGVALEAQLNNPVGLSFAQDGSLYIMDNGNARVRKVDPSGIITTVAGGGSSSADDIPATDANLSHSSDVAAGIDGSFYVAGGGQAKVWKIDASGMISTVLTLPPGVGSVAIGLDGSVYTSTNQRLVVRRDQIGTITDYVGTGILGCYDSGHPANSITTTVADIDMGPDGDLYGTSTFINGYGGCNTLFKVASIFPGFNGTDVAVPSEDGTLLYRFSAEGRHLQTLNTLTGAVVYDFAYDTDGLLITVTDGDGNITTIERDGEGNPTAIVGPYGHRTVLVLDTNGYLSSITNPASEAWLFNYTDKGLLISATDPNGNTSDYTHDESGRLIQSEDAAGGSQTLARADIDNGYEVGRTTALGRTTTYRVENLPTGEVHLLNTFPDGLQVESSLGSDGTTIMTTPDGRTTTYSEGPDPRFGMMAPFTKSLSVEMPAGTTLNLTASKTATLNDPEDPLSLQNLTRNVPVNGNTYTHLYDAGSYTNTLTSPEGRNLVTIINEQGKMVSNSITDFTPLTVEYDNNGRIHTIGQGARTITFNYGADGFVSGITDPLSRTVDYSRDAVGRITNKSYSDGREILFGYDNLGNLTSITPPGRPAHIYTYSQMNRVESYTPPTAMATNYIYDADHKLTQIQRPGITLDITYDSGGHILSMSTPNKSTNFTHDAVTGQLIEIDSDGETIGLLYNGSLSTSQTWGGTIVGNVTKNHNDDFRVVSRSINGDNVISFAYDQDGLIAQAGDLILTRDAGNGWITQTALGLLIDLWDYNDFGEITDYTANYDSSTLYSAVYERNNLGFITERSETIEGLNSVYTYGYDIAGNLTNVQKDGTPAETYSYDDNGNRLSANGSAASYDVQDRLNSFGSVSYTYTDNGELQIRSEGEDTTSYSYDFLGNLLEVTLPNGTLIEYIVDGANRRIGKKVDGILIKGFLYKDSLSPVAEIDSSGDVVSRFIYGSKINIPDYMIRGGNTYRIISDHLGSPRLVVDITTGNVAQRIDYDTYGNITNDTAPSFQPFGFAGGLYDPETRLTRFGFRDYDAESGRWTAKDPILFEGGDSNLYKYALGNPVNVTDVTGLSDDQSGEPACFPPGEGDFIWIFFDDLPPMRLDTTAMSSYDDYEDMYDSVIDNLADMYENSFWYNRLYNDLIEFGRSIQNFEMRYRINGRPTTTSLGRSGRYGMYERITGGFSERRAVETVAPNTINNSTLMY